MASTTTEEYMIQATGLKTLWYMGSKARIVPEFIDGALKAVLGVEPAPADHQLAQ